MTQKSNNSLRSGLTADTELMIPLKEESDDVLGTLYRDSLRAQAFKTLITLLFQDI